MAVGVSSKGRCLHTLMILHPVTSMHNHSVFDCSRAGLHNSESSKGQIDQHTFEVGPKSLFHFVVIWKKFCNNKH